MIIGTSSPPYRPWLPTLPPLASPPYRPWLPSLPPLATRHTLPSPRTAIGVTRGRYGSVRLHHLDDHRDSTGILPGEHTDADQAQGVAGTLAADIHNAIRSPRDRPPLSAELNRETRTRHALDTHSTRTRRLHSSRLSALSLLLLTSLAAYLTSLAAYLTITSSPLSSLPHLSSLITSPHPTPHFSPPHSHFTPLLSPPTSLFTPHFQQVFMKEKRIPFALQVRHLPTSPHISPLSRSSLTSR